MTTDILIQTGSQTVGPFFHYALINSGQNILVTEHTRGTRITISGTVTDGDGKPVPDAFLEIWQADNQGIFKHPSDPNHEDADPNFQGFGRSATNQAGHYVFETIKPGIQINSVTPYINVRIFARGMLIHAVTRIYFDDESTNADDSVYSFLDEERRDTLIAKKVNSEGRPHYKFDISLQGANETVFFDV